MVSKRLKRIMVSFMGILFSIIFALILGECGLRILVHFNLYGNDNGFTMLLKQVDVYKKKTFGTVAKTGLFRLTDDPEIKWEPVPGAAAYDVRINSYGFRGGEIEKVPDRHLTRIAFLGDSDTFGILLREEETVPASLQKYLNQFAEKDKFEVLNFGVPGYNTAQEFALLKKKVLSFQPSIVVLYYVFNDPIIADPNIHFKSNYLSRFYLYLAMKYFFKSVTALDELNRNTKSLVGFYQELYASRYFRTVKGLIVEMGGYLHERDIRFILLIDPEVIGFPDWGRYPYLNIHEKLQHLTSKHIEIVDPLDVLADAGLPPTAYWVNSHDCHKNARANRIIAAVLAEYILSNSKDASPNSNLKQDLGS